MVRDVLADPDLDPTVRALAIERLEASLHERATSLLGADRAIRVRLDEAGVPRVFEGDAELVDEVVTKRLELELLARLAPTVGAARVDVKRGARPSKPRDPTPRDESVNVTAEGPPWAELVRRLAALARRQNARIAALEAAIGADRSTSEHRDIEQELRRIEATVQASKSS